MMGEYTFPDDYKNKIDVIVNLEKKTLKFIDTGLGMTADEVEEYITQIAFSGATKFLEQYKDKTNDFIVLISNSQKIRDIPLKTQNTPSISSGFPNRQTWL